MVAVCRNEAAEATEAAEAVDGDETEALKTSVGNPSEGVVSCHWRNAALSRGASS